MIYPELSLWLVLSSHCLIAQNGLLLKHTFEPQRKYPCPCMPENAYWKCLIRVEEGCLKPPVHNRHYLSCQSKVVRTVHFPLGAWPYQYWRSNPSSTTSAMWHDKPPAGLGDRGPAWPKSASLEDRFIHLQHTWVMIRDTNGPTAFPKNNLNLSPFTFPRAEKKHGANSLDLAVFF